MSPRLRGSSTAAVLAAAAVLLPCLPAAAQQPKPTHVAVVVDGIGTACVPWHSGMTGADVLTARFTVQWGQQTPGGNYAGMVVQINGDPAAPNPHTAYWAYFHSTGSGWQYSGTGALSSHPQPGTVEGWRLDSAASSSHPQPSAASYASICAGQDPSPVTTHANAPVSHPHSRPPTHAPTTVQRHADAPARQATTTPARPRAAHRSPSARPSARSATPARTVASYAASTPTATPSSTPTAALTRHDGGGFPPWGTALAIVVVLALGGGALWRTRRNPL